MTELMDKDSNTLRNIIHEKGIQYLTHYTNVNNLNNILQYGIMPLNLLRDNHIIFYNNDTIRVDYTDAICLNIEFPNYKLFFTNRKNTDYKWAVIILNAKILYTLDVAFCHTNAANHHVSSIPMKNRKTVNAFLSMFYDNEEHNLRKQLNIPDKYTTDPQAEILVFEPIDTSNIIEIHLQTKDLATKFTNLYPNFKFINSCDLFYPRSDYNYWSNNDL